MCKLSSWAALVFGLSLLAIVQARAKTVEIGNVEEISLALYGTVAGGDSTRLGETTMYMPMN